MININATVVEHSLLLNNSTSGATAMLPSSSVAIDQIQFTFTGSDWTNATTKKAVFWQDPSAIYTVTIANNAAVIPAEVLANPGIVYVAIIGVNGSTRISTYARPFAAEQGALTADNAPAPTPSLFEQAVEAALDAIVDDTLSIAGKAADAKATGDRITSSVLPLMQGESWEPNLVKGETIAANGNTGISSKRCRTYSTWAAAGTRTAIEITDSTYKIYVAEYGSDSSISSANYIGAITDGFVSGLVMLPISAVRFAAVFTRADEANITDEDIAAIRSAVKQYRITDTTLSNANAPADARTVGDKLQVSASLVDTLFSSVNTSLSYTNNRYVDYSDGSLKVSTTNILFGGYVSTQNTVFRCSDATYQIAAYYYDGYNGNYLGYTSYGSVKEGTIFVPQSIPYVRIVARRADKAVLTDADKAAIVAAVEMRKMPVVPSSLVAPMRTLTRRNNASYVDQFLAVASSYLGQDSIFYDDGNTVFYKSTETHGIDCSTFVNLCLLGYPFEKTPYYTGNYIAPTAWVPNPDYEWGINPLNYKVAYTYGGTGTQTAAKYACQLAKWMYDRNWSVSLENGFEDVRPGDIVFWARKVKATGEWSRPDWWQHINHVGIILSKEAAPENYEYTAVVNNVSTAQTGTWDKTKYPYKHTIIEVVNASPAPCIDSNWLERGQEDPTNVYANNVNTIVMIARPDLGALAAAGGGGGGGGTDNAVLYTAQTLTTPQKAQARNNIGAGTYSKPGTGITKTDLAQSVRDSLDLADSALQSHQDISGKADKPKYTTLTLATSDWQSSGNAYSCSKTITGLTANSIVWLSYSDTETEFSEAQSANTLTFTVAELPSAAITVNVAYMEGSAL